MQGSSGKTALVAGADSAAGIAIAQALGAWGMHVTLADTRLPDAAPVPAGLDVLAIAVDVPVPGRVGDADAATWDLALETNFWPVIRLIRRHVPALRQQGRGSHLIVVLPSVAALPAADTGVYASVKSALLATVEALSAELGAEGIGTSIAFIDSTVPPAAERWSQALAEAISANHLYTVLDDTLRSEDVAAGFAPLLEAMDFAVAESAGPPGVDEAQMFPVYLEALARRAA